MAAELWSIVSAGEIALTAATAKTIANLIAAAGSTVEVRKVSISFDGVTASAEGVLCEWCQSTQATAGTSTAVTEARVRGDDGLTSSITGARNYTAEPTVLTVIDEWTVDPNKGTYVEWYPLDEGPESGVADGLALRLTAPAAVNVRFTIWGKSSG